MKHLPKGLILLASILWGLMGVFVRYIETWGFHALQIAGARILTAALLFLALRLLTGWEAMRIRRRDIPLFMGMGIASILVFTICYFRTIQITSLATAAILLYTSPSMVMVMSVLFLKEKFTARKGAALALAFAGCVLVVGVGGGGGRALSTAGALTGLCSALGYALYSVLGTVALRRYKPMTVTANAFFASALGAVFLCDLPGMLRLVGDRPNPPAAVGFLFLTGLVTAVLPYGMYTLGLNRVDASAASIMASLEPAVATVVGYAVFGEVLTPLSLCGILLVMAAIVLLNWKKPAEA